MSYYAVLSEMFLTISCSTMRINTIIMYHNILITTYLSNMPYNVKFSDIKDLSSAFCLL